MGIHANLSASGSATWLNCPGSVEASKNIEDKTSIFAEEGTFAHSIAELCLKNNHNSTYYLTHTIPKEVYYETNLDFILDKEMCDFVQIYIDYVRSFNLPFDVEVRADYSKWVKDGFGTSDCVMYDKTGTLHVVDLKYGKGIKVYAKDNTQAMLYALGSLTKYSDIDTIVMHIVQPRLDHIDTHTITYEELMVFADKAEKQSKLALSDNPPLIAGEKQCKWCKAKSTCKALAKFTEKTIMSKFDNLPNLVDINVLSNNELKTILDNKALVESFLKSVEDKIFNELSSGNSFEGYKLIEGRRTSKWISEAEIQLKELLDEDKLYKKSLISITEAKKLLDKDVIAAITYKPSGKPKLAKSTEKGEYLKSFEKF